MAKAPGEDGAQIRRLAVRAALLLAAPVVGSLLGLSGGQLGFLLAAAAVWTVFEASLVYKVKLTRPCKKVPFALRLIVAMCMNVQACWLLSPADAVGAEASLAEAVVLDQAESLGDGRVRAVKGVAQTISVVLPCANETNFVARTVKSVWEMTPPGELHEIIVVDDASRPRIDTLIPPETLKAHKARIIRHDNAEGLIRSKKDGGDASDGDVIIFLDCHVKPTEGWTKSILANLRENPKRVVVPSITSLDPDTWQEVGAMDGGKKMCLTWNADFVWCNSHPGPWVPIMSGGLLALTRYWWEEIGGYDEQMHAWGGENLDQSLRTWLCGGEIKVAEGSRVAHMWRDPSKPVTQLHYSIPTDHVRRNRLRAATAWMGPWANKVKSFPEFEDFREGGRLSIGDLSNIVYYRDKLKCKGFEWYLKRFSDYYEDTGQFPAEVYNLRDKKTGLCLHHEMSGGKSSDFALRPCSKLSENQRFHPSNAMPRGRWTGGGGCCSGIKLADWDACIGAFQVGGKVFPQACDTFGGGSAQRMKLDEGSGLLKWQSGKGCIVPDANQVGAPPPPPGFVTLTACAAPDEQVKAGQQFQRRDPQPDGSFILQDIAGRECLTHRLQGGLQRLFQGPCDQEEAKSLRWKHLDGGQLKLLELNLCVDANDQVTPILYPCYQPWENPKQHFDLEENGWVQMRRTWGDNGRMRFPAKCFDSQTIEPTHLTVQDCREAASSGHQWEKLWPEVPMETRYWLEAKQKAGFLG